jgi:hypothetical protein
MNLEPAQLYLSLLSSSHRAIFSSLFGDCVFFCDETIKNRGPGEGGGDRHRCHHLRHVVCLVQKK